ncbi:MULTISPECIES: Ku protein [Streptomyces]|uniref:Non-homologous end joining protein Ku n=1 Tax=Streptomyces odorifer TaxID=53450 RepID=A0A7Y6F1P5_9ACTN|nr:MULTISPECIES: Ku protein [Streptomyces]NUV33601.1 Ku protein [Streptomyces sp. KAI-27]NUV48622.1 Ku protein [Streptomyces sp. CAI-78]MBV1954512.1 Ku protein [Streptomyces sp. BV333]MCR0991606.1 Ku protein [Streptomyces albidoflavus]MDH6188592.1 DNA end-binding protein Ku [Streptomyces sp. CZ24]
MQSIWNGAISFGLVSIPVKLANATVSHAVSFRQIHTEDGGRIRYRKVCELEEKEVPSSEIGKGFEDADGSIVPITEEDLASLPLPTTRTIDIVAFVESERIDPLQMGNAYYLMVNGAPAAKPYALLREALRRSERVAIAKFALRGRERLGMLRVVDDVIAMHTLHWPDEIRSPEEAAPETDVTVRDAELDLADALMDTLGDVDLDSLHDDYREAVEEMVTAKVEGREPAPEKEPAQGEGTVIDLMSALESSVREAKRSRGEGEGEDAEEEDGQKGGEKGGEKGKEAEVTSLSSRRKTGSRAKSSGGSGSGAKKKSAPAKKKASSGSGSGKSTASSSRAKSGTGRSSTAKKTASSGSGTKKTASSSTSKKKTASSRKRSA